MPIREIVKVQRPLFPPGAVEVLIYDKRRQHMVQQDVPARVLKDMAGDLKAYFYAEWTPETGWVIAERIEAQGW